MQRGYLCSDAARKYSGHVPVGKCIYQVTLCGPVNKDLALYELDRYFYHMKQVTLFPPDALH